MEKILFLNNIRSAHNVGAMFRTADGAGVSQIYLGGYTPTPIDRFGRQQPALFKTSLGATESIPWEHIALGQEVAQLGMLQQAGYQIVAVEQSSTSITYYDFAVPEKVVYVLGNEIDGVDAAILEMADTTVEIPMQGQKESLNVATTAGIILFAR